MLPASPTPAFAVPVPAQERVPVTAGQREVPPLELLDDPTEWSAFSRPVTDREACWESSVVFEGMHCAACALTIEDALMAVPGVASVQVSAGSHRGRIVWSDQATRPSDWMQAARRAGYPALPANDAFANDRRKAETRRALWRMAVAGLCMMQVMMYAWPAYVAGPGDLAPDMSQLLRWASWVLTLPVMLFSCGPFFSNALRDLRQRTISMDLPVSLGMLITFVVSTAGTFDPNGIFGAEVYFDSLTMFVFFLLTGRWLELRLRDRTAGALEALMNRLPDNVQRRLADGSFERVAVRRLGAGDVVRILPGEVFPADGEVLDGETLVDESLLTGESRPLVRAPAGATGGTGASSTVIAGSHNIAAAVLMRVECTGSQTRFAQIVALMEEASTSRPHIAQLADRLARPFLVVVLLAAAGACVWWWPQDPAHAVMVAVAVLVVTCPCALSLATPAAMLASAGALARSGVLVRRLPALEALASIDTLVFDKTGTLTQDTLELTAVETRAGVTAAQALAWAAALARQSLHPASRAVVAAADADPSVQQASAAQCREEPGQGVSGQLAVAPDQFRTMRLGSPVYCGVAQPAGDALQVCLVDDGGWLATFALRESLRPDAGAALQSLRGAGLQVHLLSGDSTAAVARVAAELGIVQARGQCSPQDKLAFLRQAQADGHTVAMVGDGLNDGPVLAGADASFAFGQSVPLAQARSDFVVMGDCLSLVAQTVWLARRTMSVVRQNLAWAAAYNLVCIPLAVAGWLPAWLAGLGMALSSLVVVGNALRLSYIGPAGGAS